MSGVVYRAVIWNRQKRIYDTVAVGGVLAYLLLFVGLGSALHPNATLETLLIRAFGTCAFGLLHVVLAIGPLTRLDKRFLPFLYNRRHLGVLLFLLALAHGFIALIQFHGFSDAWALENLLRAFPSFQLAGLGALAILFTMAATSHDVWLHWLTPGVWKRLHMGVYLAYLLLVAHVAFGFLQSETNPVLVAIVAIGAIGLSVIHIAAARKEAVGDRAREAVCRLEDIPDQRAVTICSGGERIAIFRLGDRVSAVSNVCRHQNGPLGEGKIIDGCITCPWHGYQYDPFTGKAPAPFDDRIPVYPSRVENGLVYIDIDREE